MQDLWNALFALAALVAILDYFGIKPRRKADGPKMSLSRAWKLAIMLTLVAASLTLSGYSFYRSRRPLVVEKIVEKPVDRIVEKVVQPDCPPPKTVTSPKAAASKQKPSQTAPSTSGNNSAAVGSISQGAGSALSFNQSGGLTAGTVNIGSVKRQINPQNEAAIVQWLSQKPSDISLAVTLGDVEAMQYAEEWEILLKKAGWRIVSFTEAVEDQTVYGINITMHGDVPSQPGQFEVFPDEPSYFLGNALRSEGAMFNGHRDPKQALGTLTMFVGVNGTKPQ